MKRTLAATLTALLATSTFGCAPRDQVLDGENTPFPTGKTDGGIDEGSAEALAVLALVNDPSVDFAELDLDAGLHATAARNIIDYRNGPDAQVTTSDDEIYDDLAELDKVAFVGPSALTALLDYAKAKGLLSDTATEAAVIFSPQPLESSHNSRIAKMIDDAQESIDIAMYSYSSAEIAGALRDAVDRGVDVRFIFETANASDKKLTGSALLSSKSGRLEQDGIDVRYINKIMHHKFILVDGPRHDVSAAASSSIASGSANWSSGGATIYDENTLFLTGVPEAALEMQREFDRMWTHSSDLVVDATLPFTTSTLDIDDASIPDDPDLDVYFTSDNFDVADGSTSFRLRSREDMRVSDVWVQAIEDATESIWIASGHMRLRPVAEALIAKKQANPDMDIRVYVDQQEYISVDGNASQIESQELCLQGATTPIQIFDCENKSFLWARAIGEAGIETRYKYYAYRWHFSYAEQMHNKFMIIDGDELLSGSYNLSINAEHNTFENVMHLRAPTYSGLVQTYVNYFEDVMETGRGNGELDALRDEIETASMIPLVFGSMALTYDEATSLKSLIRANCSQVDSSVFRKSPQTHKLCPRN